MKHKSEVLEKFKEFKTATMTDSRNRTEGYVPTMVVSMYQRSLKLT